VLVVVVQWAVHGGTLLPMEPYFGIAILVALAAFVVHVGCWYWQEERPQMSDEEREEEKNDMEIW
jgi:hypothetical protein